MRRLLIAMLLLASIALLAGCGNKGPLVRATAKPATTPAPAATTASAPTPAMSAGSVR